MSLEELCSRRRSWTFSFSQNSMSQAARAKVDYHTERLAYWEAEKRRIDDSIGLLNDCEPMYIYSSEIDEHQSKLREYETYLRAFNLSDMDETFELTVEDMEFFDL